MSEIEQRLSDASLRELVRANATTNTDVLMAVATVKAMAEECLWSRTDSSIAPENPVSDEARAARAALDSPEVTE